MHQVVAYLIEPPRAMTPRCKSPKAPNRPGISRTRLILIEVPSSADHGGLRRVPTPSSRTRRRPQGDSTPHSTPLTGASIDTPAPWTCASSTKAVTRDCTVTCKPPQRRFSRPSPLPRCVDVETPELNDRDRRNSGGSRLRCRAVDPRRPPLSILHTLHKLAADS
jgi:hypothetical protein